MFALKRYLIKSDTITSFKSLSHVLDIDYPEILVSKMIERMIKDNHIAITLTNNDEEFYEYLFKNNIKWLIDHIDCFVYPSEVRGDFSCKDIVATIHFCMRKYFFDEDINDIFSKIVNGYYPRYSNKVELLIMHRVMESHKETRGEVLVEYFINKLIAEFLPELDQKTLVSPSLAKQLTKRFGKGCIEVDDEEYSPESFCKDLNQPFELMFHRTIARIIMCEDSPIQCLQQFLETNRDILLLKHADRLYLSYIPEYIRFVHSLCSCRHASAVQKL